MLAWKWIKNGYGTLSVRLHQIHKIEKYGQKEKNPFESAPVLLQFTKVTVVWVDGIFYCEDSFFEVIDPGGSIT